MQSFRYRIFWAALVGACAASPAVGFAAPGCAAGCAAAGYAASCGARCAAGCGVGPEGLSLLQLRPREQDWAGDEVLVHYEGHRPPEFFEMLHRVHSAATKRGRNMSLIQQNVSKLLTLAKVADVP